MDPEERKIAALIAAFDQEHERLQRIIVGLNNAGEQLQREVRGAAKGAVETALTELNQKVRAATQILGELERFSLWRAAWQHLVVAVTAIVVTLIAVWWYVPSVGEMDQLRAERGELQASIDDLSQRGERIQLSECGDAGQRQRLFVRVDAKAGEFGDGRDKVYMIAEGY